MAAYFIAQVSIQDRAAYQAYEQGFMAILDEHDGQLVSVDEQPLVLEGDWACTRTVLLRFETAEAGRPGTTVTPIRRWPASSLSERHVEHRYGSRVRLAP